ncbi:MAG: hypothetical protein V2I31_04255, partial [Mariniphaga sp.]|nr:hypothetical protein [Mariniphaga sp.]
MFANNYLKKNAVPVLLPESPALNLSITVVIPCYREPEIIKTLQSLFSCRLPDSGIEVILLINHSEIAPETVKIQNRKTK